MTPPLPDYELTPEDLLRIEKALRLLRDQTPPAATQGPVTDERQAIDQLRQVMTDLIEDAPSRVALTTQPRPHQVAKIRSKR